MISIRKKGKDDYSFTASTHHCKPNLLQRLRGSRSGYITQIYFNGQPANGGGMLWVYSAFGRDEHESVDKAIREFYFQYYGSRSPRVISPLERRVKKFFADSLMTGRRLTDKENKELSKYMDTIVINRVSSNGRH